MNEPGTSIDRRPEEGAVLPLVLVGLMAAGILALAGYDAARFAVSAARHQAAATAALHAADSGLDLFLAGVGPSTGPLAVDAPPASAVVSVVGLVELEDASRIVAVISEGRMRAGLAPPVVRQTSLLARIAVDGQRSRVRGSWRERF
ncbi:MAG TPA: hypothetical protein VLA33_03105 [Gemmatimonadota bacterium]|nr:hypothetical protein [Gemmatimonadota bacterium]